MVRKIFSRKKSLILLIECNRTNKKDCQEESHRPDSAVSIMSQSQWSRNLGHGEAKIAEASENYHVLAWDLCRLGYFNKNIINKENVSASFAFQSKGMINFKERKSNIGIYLL